MQMLRNRNVPFLVYTRYSSNVYKCMFSFYWHVTQFIINLFDQTNKEIYMHLQFKDENLHKKKRCIYIYIYI